MKTSQTTRYFKCKNKNKKTAEDSIWRLDSDGSWYVKNINESFGIRKGPWDLKSIKAVFNHGNRYGWEIIEMSEKEVFLELI